MEPLGMWLPIYLIDLYPKFSLLYHLQNHDCYFHFVFSNVKKCAPNMHTLDLTPFTGHPIMRVKR
jgi:hypothetical protein